MRQLSGLDASFLNLETPTTPLHVSSALILDGPTAPEGFGYDHIKRLLLERLDRLPPYRWRLVEVPFGLDHPYWVQDPDFDIEFHLRRAGTPPPHGEREFAEVVERIHARSLDRRRPLWETYVFEDLRDGHVALVTKMHHAAIDGVSGAEILTSLVELEPLEPPELPDTPAGGDRIPGQLEMLARGGRGLLRQPRRVARFGFDVARNLPVLGSLAAMALPDALRRNPDGGLIDHARMQAPHTPFNGTISPHRRFAFGSVSLDTVKAIKNAHGATVNDVVMTICASALRAHLDARGQLPDQPLQAMVPISVRTEEERGEHGNKVTAMVAVLPTHLPDPLERLAFVTSNMKVAKEHNAVPAEVLQDLTQFAPPAIAARAGRVIARTRIADRVRMPFNVVISNVPGPPVPLYLAGARMRHLYPISAIADGVGLNITLMSYLDRIDFGIVGCRERAPAVWELLEQLQQATDELAQLTD